MCLPYSPVAVFTASALWANSITQSQYPPVVPLRKTCFAVDWRHQNLVEESVTNMFVVSIICWHFKQKFRFWLFSLLCIIGKLAG